MLAYDVETLKLKIFFVFIYRPAVSIVVYIDILPSHFITNLHRINHIINN